VRWSNLGLAWSLFNFRLRGEAFHHLVFTCLLSLQHLLDQLLFRFREEATSYSSSSSCSSCSSSSKRPVLHHSQGAWGFEAHRVLQQAKLRSTSSLSQDKPTPLLCSTRTSTTNPSISPSSTSRLRFSTSSYTSPRLKARLLIPPNSLSHHPPHSPRSISIFYRDICRDLRTLAHPIPISPFPSSIPFRTPYTYTSKFSFETLGVHKDKVK
jgi:hypothetical protein